ncbi:MAG: hypothetical protein QM736_16635 [Vicinamibacterales bacterium]
MNLSPFVQWLLGATGSGLNAYGQGEQQANIPFELTPKGKGARLTSFNYWFSQLRNAQNANGVLNADPLGADQRYAQRNALLSAILPNLTNMRSTPPDPGVAAAMRSSTMNALTPNAPPMNGSVQQQKPPTNAALPDTGSMYGAPSSAPPRRPSGPT